MCVVSSCLATKQISSHQKGGGVSRWGEWVRVGKATAYKFVTCTFPLDPRPN